MYGLLYRHNVKLSKRNMIYRHKDKGYTYTVKLNYR